MGTNLWGKLDWNPEHTELDGNAQWSNHCNKYPRCLASLGLQLCQVSRGIFTHCSVRLTQSVYTSLNVRKGHTVRVSFSLSLLSTESMAHLKLLLCTVVVCMSPGLYCLLGSMSFSLSLPACTVLSKLSLSNSPIFIPCSLANVLMDHCNRLCACSNAKFPTDKPRAS